MFGLRVRFIALFFPFFPEYVRLLDNGLARTPPMGWMSWGYYMCGDKCDDNPEKCLDEQLIMSVADTFYEEGYQEAGFEYIIIDDCWSEKKRDEYGRLFPDTKRFPRGMKYLADYINARGLKFGMYTNIATTTCMRYPGSRGHFSTDAKTFAEWGVDYIKVDGCFVEEAYLNTAYIKLGHYLNETGRPMVYSCSWPYYIEYIHKQKADYSSIATYCNLWRNYHDVVLSWSAIKAIMDHYEREYYILERYHGPGHWNDPDMLIFGTGTLSDSQSRVHLAVYAMWSVPLLLSCNMARIRPYERQLLQNLELMAIAKDPLGAMAKPYKLADSVTLWVKHHLPMKGDAYHTFSFALVNVHNQARAVSFAPRLYGLNSTDGYTIMDVFTEDYLRNITLNDTIDVDVPPEAQKVLLGDAPDRVLNAEPSLLATYKDKLGNVCSQDAYKGFQKSLYEFYTKLNSLISENSKGHYVFSPLFIWLSIMTIAEGCEPIYQKELFSILNLPEEKCLREQYYAMSLKHLTERQNDVSIASKNLFVLDEYTKVEPNWAKFANDGFLELAFVPIKDNPNFASEQLRNLLKFRSSPALYGNSGLFNSIDFQFLWTYAFADSKIQRNAPFYNDAGKEIGRVDMMKMRRRVRLANMPLLNAKVVELPIGHNGRYKMIIVMNNSLGLLGTLFANIGKYLSDILGVLTESAIPLDVAIPRFDLEYEYDARRVLEAMGIRELWNNPAVTSYISRPPALPGSYYQRVYLKVGNEGLEAPIEQTSRSLTGGLFNLATDVVSDAVSVVGREFIANKPFAFMILESETNGCVLAGAYSGPTIV
ncbi:uncharacterized protein LOC131850182 [Achroia grisella]|uniref:uncharacterized protein LOC131850182 n=1 Tax=Achroia grisella TaxID=688607 RepID=UPI0027D30EEB|nr:uncharacterized protein LOC131850182 [Achroia grisella]